MGRSKGKSAGRKHFEKTTKHNSPIRAKKHLGQHFLKDENMAKKIAGTLSFEGYENVLEIGPGTGMLTKYLAKKDGQLTVVDLDTESISYLRKKVVRENPDNSSKNSFQIIEGDFLKFDLSTLFGKAPFAVTGNFPYNISSQIIFKVLEWRHQIPELTGMFQKEVAQRICEKEGSKIYGILSVLTQAFYETEYLFTVGPQVFNPPPKVESGVLRLVRKKDFGLPCDEKLFFKVVKTAFQQRRKTLRNSLKSFQFSADLKEHPIFARRPEQLGVEEFVGLTQKIADDAISNK